MRKIMIAAAAVLASGALAVPASAQQAGLINVTLGDVAVDVSEIVSRNNIQVAVPVSAATVVQVPIGLAANVCGTTVALLSVAGSTGTCTANSAVTNQGEAMALARALQRQSRRAN